MRHRIDIQICGVVPVDWGQADDSIIWSTDDRADRWTLGYRAGALIDVGAFSAAIEEGQAIAQSAVTSFSIIADEKRAGIGNRAIDYFGRVGAENLTSADVWATVGVAAGDTSVALTGGTAQALAAPYALHIGTELVWPSPIDQTIPADGTITINRGRCQTLARPHRANNAGLLARTIPVTKYPTQWIGRRVLVYVDGVIWREGLLTENPQISGDQILFSYVSNENMLSVDRSGDYIPTYGTTLVPTSSANWSSQELEWTPFWSVPEKRIQIANSECNELTRSDIEEQDDSNLWEINSTNGATGAAAKLVSAWWHWDGELLGVWCLPRVFAEISGPKNNTIEWSHRTPFLVENTSNQYFENDGDPPNCLYAGIVLSLDTASQAYQAMMAANLAESGWQLTGIRTAPFTSANPSSEMVTAKTGESSGLYESSSACVYGMYDAAAPICFKLGGGVILCRNCCSSQEGYPFTHDVTWGIVWRRNLRPDETVDVTSANGNLFTDYPVLNVNGSDWVSQKRPINPDGRVSVSLCYPIRPTDDGTVHHVIVSNGCALYWDAWTVPYDIDRFSVGVDIATAYWELGLNAIQTLALIPGVGDTWADVSINWEEPDGTTFSATATVRRWTAYDSGGVYGYHIQNVKMDDGTTVVGFGTWPGHAACTITRPVRASGRLGTIVPLIVASDDGTSGRPYDGLGDGLGCPLTAMGVLSLATLDGSSLPAYWQFSPTNTSYADFLRIAALASGKMIVGRPNPISNAGGDVIQYGPEARPSGRPTAGEAVAAWTDDDFVGLPMSSGESGLVYTSYRLVAGDTLSLSAIDWLAADQLGQGEACEIDLTGIYSRPRMIRKENAAALIDELRDRYGTQRRRWSVQIPIDIGLSRCVGDVIDVTSEYLIGADGTGPGVSHALARIVSISHDFKSGLCTVDLLAWASYGAGYNISLQGTIMSVSSSTYVVRFPLTGDTPADTERRRRDVLGFMPDGYSSSYYYNLIGVSGYMSGGYMYGYFVSGSRTVTDTYVEWSFYRSSYGTPSPTTGTNVALIARQNRTATADLFRLNRDKLM